MVTYPKDWREKTFNAFLKIKRGASPRPIESYLTSNIGGVNWIKIGDAPRYGKYITSTEEKITTMGAAHSVRVFPGDFILSNSMSFGRPYPEDNGDYPDEVKNSAARRALFDYFEEDLELTVDVDGAIRIAIRPAWKKNRQKQQKIRLAIYEKLLLHSYSKDKAEEETNQVFDIAQRQEEYDA